MMARASPLRGIFQRVIVANVAANPVILLRGITRADALTLLPTWTYAVIATCIAVMMAILASYHASRVCVGFWIVIVIGVRLNLWVCQKDKSHSYASDWLARLCFWECAETRMALLSLSAEQKDHARAMLHARIPFPQSWRAVFAAQWGGRYAQPRAIMIDPASTSSAPIATPPVSFSPRNSAPKATATSTLSRSMGATRAASPNCKARK